MQCSNNCYYITGCSLNTNTFMSIYIVPCNSNNCKKRLLTVFPINCFSNIVKEVIAAF